MKGKNLRTPFSLKEKGNFPLKKPCVSNLGKDKEISGNIEKLVILKGIPFTDSRWQWKGLVL